MSRNIVVHASCLRPVPVRVSLSFVHSQLPVPVRVRPSHKCITHCTAKPTRQKKTQHHAVYDMYTTLSCAPMPDQLKKNVQKRTKMSKKEKKR